MFVSDIVALPTMCGQNAQNQEGDVVCLSLLRIRKVIQRNDGKEEKCDERDGWCLPRTTDDLRNVMSSLIKQAVRDQRPGERGTLTPAKPRAQLSAQTVLSCCTVLSTGRTLTRNS